jgi:transcriptional regulator with XRE-family HTH domain
VGGKPRSMRQAQSLQAARLRDQGRSWAEIAAAFGSVYRVNPRVALRQAHGWSQPQAAARWNARWPEDPKTFKSFSYWEQWPGETGHAPSLETLDRLAQLYECKITDLLADCHDYGKAPLNPTPGLVVRDRLRAGQDATVSTEVLHAALETIRQAEHGELAAVGGDDEADEPAMRMQRRTLLLEASSALAVMAAAPVLEVPRLVGAVRADRARVDLGVVSFAGEVVAGIRRLGGAVGPRITLPPAMALRSAMAALARSAPEVVTSEALTAYGDLTQLIGWLMFNLGDPKAAQYYYNDARAAAHRAANDDLVAYTLAATSQLAAARHRPRHAIDHGLAAQAAAKASGSPYAMAYAADVTARAYASSGQLSRCYAALDREQAALCQIAGDTPRSPWWYFYDESFYWGTESECKLKLGQAVDAWAAAGRALGLVEPHNLHNSALTLAFRAEALIRQGEVEQACASLADAARLTTMNSSRRIARRIDALHAEIGEVADTAAVRDLDEQLAEYRRARAAGEAADNEPALARAIRHGRAGR